MPSRPRRFRSPTRLGVSRVSSGGEVEAQVTLAAGLLALPGRFSLVPLSASSFARANCALCCPARWGACDVGGVDEVV